MGISPLLGSLRAGPPLSSAIRKYHCRPDDRGPAGVCPAFKIGIIRYRKDFGVPNSWLKPGVEVLTLAIRFSRSLYLRKFTPLSIGILRAFFVSLLEKIFLRKFFQRANI